MNTKEHALQCFSISSVGPLLDFRQALCRVANGELDNQAFGICHNAEALGSRQAYVLVQFLRSLGLSTQVFLATLLRVTIVTPNGKDRISEPA